MLDVHLPEHRIGGVRDFLLHLFTITVGLLIALGLENAVERLHHRHQREEADGKIRQEMRENQKRLGEAQQRIGHEITGMTAVLNFLEAASSGKVGDLAGLDIGFSEGPLRDAAWHTASVTGVLDYLGYDTVQRFSVVYKEQDQFEALQKTTLDDYLQLQSYVVQGFDPKKLNPQDLQTAIPVVRHTLAHLSGMLDVSRGAMEAYEVALKSP